MKILKLQTIDLFSYASLDLKLDDLGLVLVEGENGAGKSNIFESLVWVLLGDLLTKDRADDVIRIDHTTNEAVLGNSRGLVWLEINSQTVEIRRYRKHNQYKNKVLLFVDNNEITGSSDVETQKRIDDLLQMDKETFLATVMFPQEATRFASGTDAEQKAILDRLLCLERFGKAQERKKKEVASLKLSIASLTSSISALSTKIADLSMDIEKLEILNQEFEQEKQAEIAKYQKELEELKEPKKDETLGEKIKELKVLAKKNDKASQALDTANSEILRLRADKTFLEKEIENYKSLQNISTEPQKPEKSSCECEQDLLQARQLLAFQEARLSTIDMSLASLKLKLDEKQTTEQCWTCGQFLPPQIKLKLFGNLEADIESQELEKKSYEGQRRASKIAEHLHLQSLDEAEKYEAWLYEKKVAEEALNQIEIAKNAIIALDSEMKDFEDLKIQAKQMFEESQEAKVALAGLEGQVRQENAAREAWERERVRLEGLSSQARKRPNGYAPLLGGKKIALDKSNNDCIKWSKYKKCLEEELSYAEFWVSGFSNSGVKSFLLDAVVPELNDSLNDCLKYLSNGKACGNFSTQTTLASGETREKFHVDIHYADGAKKYKNLSGGERRRCDIATMFAMADLAMSRSRAPIKMRLLDEVFDNLDADGKEKVMEYLQDKVLPKVGTLLVMSHDDDLKAYFDKRIVVSKVNGISVIS